VVAGRATEREPFAIIRLRRALGMPHGRTRVLLVAATLISGVLAGGIVDRAIVGGPAWHELGADAWMQYSRLADLGSGLIAYPVEGVGSTLLMRLPKWTRHGRMQADVASGSVLDQRVRSCWRIIPMPDVRRARDKLSARD
jgi:hypothetical protein